MHITFDQPRLTRPGETVADRAAHAAGHPGGRARDVDPHESGLASAVPFLVDLGRSSGTFRLDVHDVLANDEHSVALCTLSASRGTKLVETPVANVSYVRDGEVTEFWGATTDPQASIDFWS